jgi:hypothetical protein
MQSVTGFIRRRLKLKVNETKSAVARPQERKFLGFSFTYGAEPKRRIAPKALLRCKQRVRELRRRTRGISLEQMTKELASYLRGWKSYFGYCQTPSVLHGLIRSVDSAQAAFRDLGAKEETQLAAAGQQRRVACALPQCSFRRARTSTLVRWVAQPDRTAVCGPACTVVWQGRAGDRSPYADWNLATNQRESRELFSGDSCSFARFAVEPFALGCYVSIVPV